MRRARYLLPGVIAIVGLASSSLVVAQAGAPAPLGPPQAATAVQTARPTPGPLYDGTVKIGTSGLAEPVLVKSVLPSYTDGAMRQRIQGNVTVLARIEADGTVSYAEIDHSLDDSLGLDAEALKAVKQWTFIPAKLDGGAVPVVVTLTTGFRSH